ncbi:MAG: serine/threonine-protein phosphatase [Pseudomonadales bacterium]|nr:serine/threonine-protein phosphatase [Pseudomonadales bacterium]MCP5185221.1 serine/threonine-protein phosphatase [Pseudomonadales bacterium]
MSLLVIQPDGVPDPLLARLSGINEYRCVPSADAARALFSADLDDIILARSEAQVRELIESEPLLDVVLICADEPDASQALQAMRAGALDVWNLAESVETLGERQQALVRRLRGRRQAVRERWLRHESDVQRDQRAGRYIQLGMLPPNPMMVGDYVLRHRVVPSAFLSGDFIDYFAFAQHYLAAYVADVSGHGASSAFVTVLLKNFSRRIRREYRVDMLTNPGQILALFNRELIEQKIDKHVTLSFVLIDLRTDELLYVNAGHYPQAILVDGSGARFLEATGRPVGLFPEVSYTAESAIIGPGERLVLFSDGVLEMLGGDSLTAKEALLLDAAGASDQVDVIWQMLGLRSDDQGPDDMSCLIVSREP